MVANPTALIVVSLLWIASEATLAITRRSDRHDQQIGHATARFLWLVILISVAAGIAIGFQRVGYVDEAANLGSLFGFVTIIAGLALRWTAILTLRKRFTVDVAITKDHTIVRTGIYRFVRHPSYSGLLLSFFGLGITTANFISLVVIFIPISVAFLYRIHVEERALIEAFGAEYETYRAETKRLIPWVY